MMNELINHVNVVSKVMYRDFFSNKAIDTRYYYLVDGFSYGKYSVDNKYYPQNKQNHPDIKDTQS